MSELSNLMKGKELALRPVIGGFQVTDYNDSRHSYAFISSEDLHEPDPARVVFTHDGYKYELHEIPNKNNRYRLYSCVSAWATL